MSHHIFQIWVEMAAEMYQRWSLPASTILSGSELVQYKLPNTTLAKKKETFGVFIFIGLTKRTLLDYANVSF